MKVLAGAPGFEPGNGGIKIRCLTTWLRPIGPTRGGPHLYSEGIFPAILRSQATLAGQGPGGYNPPSPHAVLLLDGSRRCPFGLTVGRSVAQPGSALASGARGREFESPRSDHSALGPGLEAADKAGWALASCLMPSQSQSGT